ncbi:GL10781 [Drosophila persimilis]|uniref:GL10781 n=1 Tax=Drosophila persimilis TaxID=7234 RepID=B4GA13_DROPE|nr:GL10781 [Drosophila persimilis]
MSERPGRGRRRARARRMNGKWRNGKEQGHNTALPQRAGFLFFFTKNKRSDATHSEAQHDGTDDDDVEVVDNEAAA